MKKSFKAVILAALCMTMVFSSCKNGCKNGCKKQAYDTETRPLTFAIGALDSNFNPFFSTTVNDGNVAAMTQLSMLSIDKNGNIVAGKNEPTAVLDYKYATTADESSTTYEFLIKNDIKFSDGEPLTIKDVLFNLYVYLDPLYTGSATIYSTDIKGLKAYQNQTPNMSDDDDNDVYSSFTADGYARLLNLQNYLANKSAATEQILKDVDTLKQLFREEITSDWTANQGTLDSYKDEFTFTEDWEVYLFNEGIVTYVRDMTAGGSSERRKDENGKFVTTLDTDHKNYYEMMDAAASDDKVAKYIADHPGADRAAAEYELKKQQAIDLVYALADTNNGLLQIATYWQSGSNALTQFTNEAMSKWAEEQTASGNLRVPTISGITTYRTTSFKGVNGEEKFKNNDVHEVLKVEINGVDPKALMNFAFSVAPMHYYSNKTLSDKALAELNTKETGYTEFGVQYANIDFMNSRSYDGVANEQKTGVPVGAGAYKASNRDHTTPTMQTFYALDKVYYERNEYFYTVGEDGKGKNTIENAKIKYFNYAVTSEDTIMSALLTEAVDYAEPNATQDNKETLDKSQYSSFLKYTLVDTNGYGYVGINPKYVPELEVRQALMRSMNTASIIINYYTDTLATPIYRPMSNQSWAYPKDANGRDIGPFTAEDSNKLDGYGSMEYTTDSDVIIGLVESVGYTAIGSDDGIRYNPDNGRKLEFTFTIAGDSTDHPAFSMFNDTKAFLEPLGFKISVKQDINALSSLAVGGLEVWAAAWSAAIDPDMYQVYHKDSRATSVNNWYYSGILNDTTGTYDREKAIINKLSDLIDEGRSTNNQQDRAEIYHTALDYIMELAVELPTYQRKDMFVFNKNIIDPDSLTPQADLTPYNGLTNKIWEVNYN